MSTISHDCRISVRQLPTVPHAAPAPTAARTRTPTYLVIICKHTKPAREDGHRERERGGETDVERGKTLKWDAALWHSLMGIQ